MYSVYVGNGSKTLNEPAGHLLRAKFLGTDEGGVASGFACLSSPLLVDDSHFLTPEALKKYNNKITHQKDDDPKEGEVLPQMKRQRSDGDPQGI